MKSAAFMGFVKKHPVPVICAALSLALVVAIYFRRQTMSAAEEELAQRTEEGERYAANVKNSAQLKEQLDALLAANQEVQTRVVHASQLGTNSQIFYKLEADTGVKLIDFRQLPTVTPLKTFSAVGFSVSMQGELPQLLNVLRSLESGAHYCRVLSATCNLTGSVRQAPLTLALNLELLGVP
jgi:hypothetical protein